MGHCIEYYPLNVQETRGIYSGMVAQGSYHTAQPPVTAGHPRPRTPGATCSPTDFSLKFGLSYCVASSM